MKTMRTASVAGSLMALAALVAPVAALAQIDPYASPSFGFEVPSEENAQEAAPVPEARIRNAVAVFSGLDKITGRITSFDVYVDETVQFGALKVTPRVCYTSPPDAPARTDSFVEVDEITLDRQIRRIFSGWMFADSPGLNAVEHPVYDVWLRECRMESEVPPPPAEAEQ